MKAASISDIKKELKVKSEKELMELCLKLARFKLENKELLTYHLYEAENEEAYINSVKSDMEHQFNLITSNRIYLIKKAIRKILRSTKKYIRYSKNKQTEVELLLYFCTMMKQMSRTVRRFRVLTNMYNNQINAIRKILPKLHEDLQHDYEEELKDLIS